MPKLKDNDEVLIYPYGGWHYHIKGCWMSPTDLEHEQSNYVPVTLSDVKSGKVKTNRGFKYQPCDCIERHEKGLPLNPNPWIKKKV